jgi:hypothetical protein
MTAQPLAASIHELRTGTGGTTNGQAITGGMAVTWDKKGRMILPPAPGHDDHAGLCAWLTVSFGLDPRHPITSGVRQGLDGPEGHVELRRAGAPPLRFEPAAQINAPNRLIEALSWRLTPTDSAVPAFKSEHCRQIAHVVRMLCGLSDRMTAFDEAAGIVGTYMGAAQAVESLTTYGNGPQRHEAATALQRGVDETTGRPAGIPRYLIDANTGELVIRVADLAAAARTHIGSSLPRGWLDARMEALGWDRVRLDGHQAAGRIGRLGHHARIDTYRGHLPAGDTDEAVTT